jgi:hypothetical protein
VAAVASAVGHEHALPGQAAQRSSSVGWLALTLKLNRSWACFVVTSNSAASRWGL